MSELIVVAFGGKHKADEVVLDALKQDDDVVEGVEDAVVITKDEAGKSRVKPYYDLLANQRGIKNEFWGSLISSLLTGSDSEVHERIGLTQRDVANLREMLEPDSSAILVLSQKFSTGKLIDKIKKHQGRLLQLPLTQETERELLDAMTQGKKLD